MSTLDDLAADYQARVADVEAAQVALTAAMLGVVAAEVARDDAMTAIIAAVQAPVDPAEVPIPKGRA